MGTVLVTGCDSGLGREFAVQYADAGYAVVATYHDLARRLPDHPGLRHRGLDVTDHGAFDRLAAELAGEPLDILVSNAGIGRDVRRLGEIDFGYVARMLAVNTIGPLKLVETFRRNLAAGRERRLLIVSSAMGAIGANLSGGHYGYRASKAGLNAIGRSLAIDLFGDGITVAMLHPGLGADRGRQRRRTPDRGRERGRDAGFRAPAGQPPDRRLLHLCRAAAALVRRAGR
jgi:NAD(P)-dependent dehydrogenase (short-subunit alcohol dehydrogenase family)